MVPYREYIPRDVDAKNVGGIVPKKYKCEANTASQRHEPHSSYLPLMKLDLTSKVAKFERSLNISGRPPVSVLKLAENVSIISS